MKPEKLMFMFYNIRKIQQTFDIKSMFDVYNTVMSVINTIDFDFFLSVLNHFITEQDVSAAFVICLNYARTDRKQEENCMLSLLKN
jgi:hypothetical protein